MNIKETKHDPGITVFSIPTGGTIKQAENTVFDAYSIYDLTGRKVKEGSLSTGSSATIAIEKRTPGMYILKCAGKD